MRSLLLPYLKQDISVLLTGSTYEERVWKDNTRIRAQTTILHFLVPNRTSVLSTLLSVQLRPALHLTCILLSKEHQNLVTKVHYILATTSLKFRARITKFQGDVPEVLKYGISLVRLILCTDHVKLAAAKRICSRTKTYCDRSLLCCRRASFPASYRYI
jgi:hypothetical protein